MTGNKRRILLVGVDGVGLVDLKNYQLKQFDKVFRKGVSGKLHITPLASTISSWADLATGCSLDRHRMCDAACMETDENIIRAVGPSDWTQPAFWHLLDKADRLTHRLNFPARHPEPESQKGLSVSELFFKQLEAGLAPSENSVQPSNFYTAANALSIQPEQVDHSTRSLFVPTLGNVDCTHDSVAGKLAGPIAAALSIQGIAGQAMAEHDWDCVMMRFTLIEDVQQLLRTTEPSDALLEHAHEAALRTLNLCLSTLRRLAGQHTVVLYSTRGNGGGFVALEGPGIKAGETLTGPCPEDIAPTLMQLLGHTPPAHMTGRILDEMLTGPIHSEPICFTKESGTSIRPSLHDSAVLLSSDLLESPPWRIRLKRKEQLAAARLIRGQWFESLPYLLELHREQPFSLKYALQLGQSLFHSGLMEEAAQLMKLTAELHPEAEISTLLRALSAYHTHQPHEAHAILETISQPEQFPADWKLLLVDVFQHLDKPEMADHLLDRLLQQDPDHTPALIAKAERLTAQNRSLEACSVAMRAVNLNFSSVRARLALAHAFLLQDRKEEARTAVVAALKLQPESPECRRALADCIKDEDPWGAEMLRARADASNSETHVDTRRWQYQLFLEDQQRKFGKTTLRLLSGREISDLPLPRDHLDQTEVLMCEKTKTRALLIKPTLRSEAACVEFLDEPSFSLIRGITERCRKLGIPSIRTRSVHPDNSIAFQTLEQCGYKQSKKAASTNPEIQSLELLIA